MDLQEQKKLKFEAFGLKQLRISKQSSVLPRLERVDKAFRSTKVSQLNLPTLEFERSFAYPQCRVAGVDEVGRGCLAGPVVAAALVLPSVIDFKRDPWLLEIRDSKILKPEVRETLSPLIQKWALSWSVSSASVEEINKINIFHASHLAMQRAVQALSIPAEFILVDGKFLPKTGFGGIPAQAVIKGDLKCLSIAAASIVAKVWRDHWMIELSKQYPQYDFINNKGYPTPSHKRAIQEFGVTPFHRAWAKTEKLVYLRGPKLLQKEFKI